MSERISIFSRAARDRYMERLMSGDPLRDWYDEVDIALALGQALEYINSLPKDDD